MRKMFLKLIFAVQLISFLLAAYQCVAFIPEVVSYSTPGEIRFVVAGLVLAVLMFVGILWMLLKYRVYERRWVWPVILGLILVFQLVAIFQLRPLPIWDTRSLVEEAVRMSREGFFLESQNGYFEHYSNNYAFTLLLAGICRILTLFGVQNYWICLVVINALVMDAAIAVGTHLLTRIASRRIALIFLAVIAICPITYVFTWYVYTSTFSVLSVMLLLLCLYNLAEAGGSRKGVVLWGALTGMVLAVGYLIRVTSVFVLIAAVVCLILGVKHPRKRPCRLSLLLAAAAILVSAVLTLGIYKTVENRCVDPQLREENFPIVHWLMMGQNPEVGGVFAEEDEGFTSWAVQEDGAAQEILYVLKNRLVELLHGDPLEFYLQKHSYNWAEIGHGVRMFANVNQSYGWVYKLISGQGSLVFISWVQLFYAALYLFSAWAVVHLIRSQEPPLWQSVITVTLFGAVVFYTFWEVSWIYSICFIPLVAMLAAFLPEMPVQEGKTRFPVKAIAGIVLALLLAGMSLHPLEGNLVESYDDYSVRMDYPRRSLEKVFDTIARDQSVIQVEFEVKPGKTADTVQLYTEIKDSAQGCDYVFSLYSNEGTLLDRQLLDYRDSGLEQGTVYYCNVVLPQKISEGRYAFAIEAVHDGRPDGLCFNYGLCRVGADSNPGGDLWLSGEKMEDWELQFNVF